MKAEKSLKETWEWEEKLYNKIKELPWDKAIKQIKTESEDLLRRYNIKLPRTELLTQK